MSDLVLHEENGGRKSGVEGEELLYDRGGDVVRQVPGDDGSAPLRQIRFEHVSVMDVGARVRFELMGEKLNKRGVKFERVQLLREWKKMTS